METALETALFCRDFDSAIFAQHGATALTYAMLHGSIEAVRALLAAGARFDVPKVVSTPPHLL